MVSLQERIMVTTMKYGTTVHDLIAHLKNGANEPITIETRNQVEMYSFVDYGEAKLVYASAEEKFAERQEFTPFSLRNNRPIDTKLVGVYHKQLLKLEDTSKYNLVVSHADLFTFESSRDDYSDWVLKKLSQRLDDKNIFVDLSSTEYLDFVSGKISEDQLLSRQEATNILDNAGSLTWQLESRGFEESDLTNGVILAHTNIVLDKTYEAYIMKREENGQAVFDACIRDNGTIVPLAEDAIGLKTEMDAQYRAQQYLADIIKNSTKGELLNDLVYFEANYSDSEPENGIALQIYIDGFPKDENLEGATVAKVIQTENGDIATIWQNNAYRENKNVLNLINNAIDTLKSGVYNSKENRVKHKGEER